MMPAMYSAISGLEAHQTMLDVTANNLANVDTIGFKAQRTTFVNELSQQLSGGSGQTSLNGGTNPEQVGLGVQIGSIDNIMTAGSMESTGNTLDVAIQGNGFLCVGLGTPGATPTQGVPATSTLDYTRAGNLTTDASGYLTTAGGQYVMGSSTAGGAPNTYLLIPPGSTNVSIGQDGSVSYTDENPAHNGTGGQPNTYGQTVTAGWVSLATFPNQAGLTRLAGSNWTTSPNSGPATFGTANSGTFANTQVISGELEQSNVDMATEFTNMIEAQRGYQANSSVISTADQMMQTLVSMAQGG
jgi:flagellar hook protein FlgE